MNIFYKITNENECHKNFQYVDGLNKLEGDFNESVEVDCVEGGLYFSDAKNIDMYYLFGCNLRIVTLPVDDGDFKMVRLNKKYRANMIILKEKYDLFDINNLEMILNINNNLLNLIMSAIKHDRTEFVKNVLTSNNKKIRSIVSDDFFQYSIVRHFLKRNITNIFFDFVPTFQMAIIACECRNLHFLKKYCIRFCVDLTYTSTLIGVLLTTTFTKHDFNKVLEIIYFFLNLNIMFNPPDNFISIAIKTNNSNMLNYCVKSNKKYKTMTRLKEIKKQIY